jgi:hypothetical protein
VRGGWRGRLLRELGVRDTMKALLLFLFYSTDRGVVTPLFMMLLGFSLCMAKKIAGFLLWRMTRRALSSLPFIFETTSDPDSRFYNPVNVIWLNLPGQKQFNLPTPSPHPYPSTSHTPSFPRPFSTLIIRENPLHNATPSQKSPPCLPK